MGKDKSHSTPSNRAYWAKQEADRVLKDAGLGGLGENNGRLKQPHSYPFFHASGLTRNDRSSPERPVEDNRRALPPMEYGRRGRDASSTGGLAAVATGSAVASVGAMAFLGGTLLPALLITSAITGIFVAYQYFSKTGLFKEPQPMLADQGSMLVRGASPGQEMQAMIGSEEARLANQRAEMVTGVPMEIEVPSTPSTAKPDKPLPAMMPRGGSKGLS